MTISGLSSNFYLTDNPIFVTLSDIDPTATHVQYMVTSITVGILAAKPSNLYNLSSSLTFDIAPHLKSIMREPQHSTDYSNLTPEQFNNNWIVANLSFWEVFPDGSRTRYDVTKTIIRGGKRTYDSNQNLANGEILLPTDKLPVWPSYPADVYYTDSIEGIVKSNTIPADIREQRTVKGCNPIYVKFLNSLGGYSYWLFENWETEEGNTNLGSINRTAGILDLGSDFESGLTLISKVPQRFIPLMLDLIVSKEIYTYSPDTQTWTRISSDNNTITTNPYSVNNKVKLKFNLYSRYNPALIW